MPPFQEINEVIIKDTAKRVKCEPIPLNNVGDYHKGDDGVTTLALDLHEGKSLTILDSGVVVEIATKKTWKSWENQP